MKRITVIATSVLLAASAFSLTACDTGDSGTTENKGSSTGVLNDSNEAKDVTLLGLDNQGFGLSAAKIKVVNSSSKTSDYIIEINAESKDGKKQYDTTTALVSNIKPGQSTVDTSAIFTKKIPSDAVLVLGSVDRSESL
jgi:hypothetical protein